MTQQGGRNLQDIYDSGVKRFEAVEREIKDGMANHTKASCDLCSRRESSIMQKVETSLGQNEKEVETYLQHAAASIQAAVKSEQEENEKFLARLQESLELSHRCLLQDISQFREFLQQFSENQLSQHSELLRKDCSLLVVELETQSAERLRMLRGMTAEDEFTFADHIAAGFSQTLRDYSRSPAELYDIVAAAVDGLDEALLNARQNMSTRQTATLEEIKTLSEALVADLEQTSQNGLIELETSHIHAEARLKQTYEKCLADAMTSQASLSSQLVSEFSKGLESSHDNLGNKLTELQTMSTELIEQVRSQISQTDFDIREKASALADSFESQLTERMALAREHQDSLAEDRRSLMDKINSDLSDIAQKYESRLADLSQKCLEKLSSICVDAEVSITNTHDHCAAEFRELATTHQKNIDEKTSSLLVKIETMTSMAVESIKLAAGDEGGQPV